MLEGIVDVEVDGVHGCDGEESRAGSRRQKSVEVDMNMRSKEEVIVVVEGYQQLESLWLVMRSAPNVLRKFQKRPKKSFCALDSAVVMVSGVSATVNC